ncbi:hypothetical protein SAY86_007934 [Trapa natans]|uniref:Mediator of RNA polymerase II transcription subunit 9 n=1 Tax=Trapa natans TaxID=22666 RepID=A0AAN7R0N4_TRANT|nr:hypothetical protein SAY86_007934 [Trapa natans]
MGTQFSFRCTDAIHSGMLILIDVLHLQLMEGLAEAIENGPRDQHSDALIGVKVSELKTNFDKCQQLLISIAESISSKAMTVEGQKHKLEETEQILNQRKDLIGKYKNAVEELVKSEP